MNWLEKGGLEALVELLRSSHRILVFTGAGVSTESGIPDFRSAGGIWDRYDPSLFEMHRFLGQPAARRELWRLMGELSQLVEAVQPGPAHQAIARLEGRGLLAVATQNIDGLHQRAGVPPEKVYEIHGSGRHATCLGCGRRVAWPELVQRLEAGETEPACRHCGGLLKPDIVFFGEPLPYGTLEAALAAAQQADLCLVVGSSLIVFPAAQIPLVEVRAGAHLALVNLEVTPYDRAADVAIQAPAGEVLTAALERLTKPGV